MVQICLPLSVIRSLEFGRMKVWESPKKKIDDSENWEFVDNYDSGCYV